MQKFYIVALLCNLNIVCSQFDQSTLDKLNSFAQSAYSTRPTLYNSYQLSVECIKNKIPGDFVECGVAIGAQVAAMAYACQQFNAEKRIHLFDSFEGIPLASNNDTQQPGIGAITHNVNVASLDDLLVSSGITAHSIGQVKGMMTHWGIHAHRLVYHQGWFQNTLPVDIKNIEQISLLRLDGDLYESTKVCLEYLYPKISKGGYIIIDDFGTLDGCRKAVLEYLAQHNISPRIVPISGGLGPVYWQI